MSEVQSYAKRLIEVDLPIRQISALARREKSIKDGHISTIHIWWARRPLAACRAVILASLWPDPADPLCPDSFRITAARVLIDLRDSRGGPPRCFTDTSELRTGLYDLIVTVSDWENSDDPTLLNAVRAISAAAHEALTGLNEPAVVADPFAGGGAIPFEALRVGAVPFASDLNPLPILLNKTLLEYLPLHRDRLVEQVEASGTGIRRRLQERLDKHYGAKTFKNSTKPFAFFWARRILCEGPRCGIRFPLVRSLWLRNKGTGSVALSLTPDKSTNTCTTRILIDPTPKSVADGTSKQGAATCPACSYTTPVERVRVQLSAMRGGTATSQLLAVCEVNSARVGKQYREPTPADVECFSSALEAYELARDQNDGWGRRLPDEELNHLRGFFNVVLYGMSRWGDLLAPRQALLMMELTALIRDEYKALAKKDQQLAEAVATVLTLAAGKTAQYNSSCCRWKAKGETLVDMFGRQAIPMVWDFAEAYPFGNTTGDYGKYVENACRVLRRSLVEGKPGTVMRCSATEHPLPDDSVDAFITDPPYYDAIPYADLSDYFYVWFRRALGAAMPELFREPLTPKDKECVVLSHRAAMYRNKDRSFFESMMATAMAEGRRVTKPSGIGIVVFANKSTAGWEAMLSGLIEGGWIITGSWPIDTEMGSRLRARNSAVLSSSVHLVCRPRELPDGRVADVVGDWREVLDVLPRRIHEWLPRLAAEGVVGADAIFACLGPALEVFSRYSRVEKASGEHVSLGEYLEHVWAAVSGEALSMILDDADTVGLEEDGRLTAMWLWTIAATGDSNNAETKEDGLSGSSSSRTDRQPSVGFILEFDAARKIAQGLGARLEELQHLVLVKGDRARLLPVAERTEHLLGTPSRVQETKRGRAKRKPQLSLFAALEEVAEEQGWGQIGTPTAGRTTLDRVHQAMLLFAAGRGEAVKRFLVEDGVGRLPQFWKLAQALSALYPIGTDEKRWVDGVLARKKGLGFG